MSILQKLLHATNFRSPLLRTAVPSVGAALAIQAAVGLPSVLAQSDRFYDASGALTFLSVSFLSLYLPSLRVRAAKPALPTLLAPFVRLGEGGTAAGFNWRQVGLTLAVTVWSLRLGTYLFKRVLQQGGDSRFDEMKKSPAKFAVAWFAQAVWVSLCAMPVIAVNAVPAAAFTALGGAASSSLLLTDVLGGALYAGGLAFESLADYQKSTWLAEKRDKVHDEQFMTRGLWQRSQFPNYFGESTLWTGIATVAAGALVAKPIQIGLGLSGGLAGRALVLGASYVSPAFVTFLLLKVSGVPLSEKKYNKRYGDRKDHQEWKRNTPKFFPKIF